MWLTTEELGEFPEVRADQIASILEDDSFGSFVTLSESDNGFIQAANNWSPDDACEAFVARYDSDPWILEYRDAASGLGTRELDPDYFGGQLHYSGARIILRRHS